MTDKRFSIKNISEEQLKIIHDALDLYVSAGLLQFENCVLDDFLYGNFCVNVPFSDIHDKCEELRQLITKNHPTYKEYPKGRWNLGIYNKDTSEETKQAFDMYAVLKKEYSDKVFSQAAEHDNIISLEDFNSRQEKIDDIINKNKK